MKKSILLAAAMFSAYFLFTKESFTLSNPSEDSRPEVQYTAPPDAPPIAVVVLQDVTESIRRHGVDILNVSDFMPYYLAYDRDIRLNFGIISDLSTKQLVTVELPRWSTPAPVPPYLETIRADKRNEAKAAYSAAAKRYAADSVRFFEDRARRYREFCTKVSQQLARYKERLASSTDLCGAIDVTDKALGFWRVSEVTNYVLVNSDGADSRHRKPQRLKNTAEIVLINADRKAKTDLDAIITQNMQSMDQAIEYTLSNHH